ncbi:cytochrome P450 6A1-like [Contarinia nasturtii]|uniref:cytochrome P450 6A1-like n=1 Tax=Contarinia nasturtii TaxID=265458 RepID=UPI0012D40A7E|nr:cytochrome P450 6A1-like [Contarinia nasturtii]
MDYISIFYLLMPCCVLAFLYKIGYYCFFKYQFRYWKSRGIPHEDPIIPFGNAKEIGDTKNLAHFTTELYNKYKRTDADIPFIGAYFGCSPWAIITDLELAKKILTTYFSNFSDRGLYYNDVDDPLTANLFTLDFHHWDPLRSSSTPAFTPLRMRSIFSAIVPIARELCVCLDRELDNNESLSIREFLACLTTDIIGICVFGINCNSLNNPNAEFRNYGRKLFESPRHGVFIRRILDEYPRIARMLHIKKIPDDISAFFIRVIRETIEYRERNGVQENDIMDLLISRKNERKQEIGEEKAFNELASLAFVFFQAGFDSSASTLAFCLFELAKNKNIQTKARESINEHMHNEELTYEMMEKMPYIDMVLKETLRKNPPASNMPRVCQNDFLVPGTNTVIEKGTKVIIPVYAIHHDPEIYPNPDTFDPDRFNSAEAMNNFLAFSKGRRDCIGKRFAMMQAKIGLIYLLKNFEFSLAETMPEEIPLMINNALLTPEYLHLNLTAIRP